MTNVVAPFDHNSETSQAAAESLSARTKSQQVKQVVNALVVAGETGLTADGIEVKTGLRIDSIRPRLAWLLARGVVLKTDLTRKTRFGKLAAVWKINVIPPDLFL